MKSHVPWHLDVLGAALDKAQGPLIALGNLESKLLTYDIQEVSLDKPVFVTGLARSGTTVLTEILAAHKNVTSHQYRDYPFVHAHYFWQVLRILIPSGAGKKVERSHKDGLMINAHSPEALDETLWMSFFDELHDVTKPQVLNRTTENEAFEEFYRNNILKTLYGRKTSRFVSKNNYNVTRMKYLQTLFPDARFVLPVRPAEAHIASLLKQNRLFQEAQEGDIRSQRYTRRLGHFEFGLDFRPIHTGNDTAMAEILEHWVQGDYLTAYAHYWAMIHSYIWETLENDPALKQAVHIVRYDTLCESPREGVDALLEFCDLAPDDNVKAWSDQIKAPSYYAPDFSDAERDLIKEITGGSEQLFWPSK